MWAPPAVPLRPAADLVLAAWPGLRLAAAAPAGEALDDGRVSLAPGRALAVLPALWLVDDCGGAGGPVASGRRALGAARTRSAGDGSAFAGERMGESLPGPRAPVPPDASEEAGPSFSEAERLEVGVALEAARSDSRDAPVAGVSGDTDGSLAHENRPERASRSADDVSMDRRTPAPRGVASEGDANGSESPLARPAARHALDDAPAPPRLTRAPWLTSKSGLTVRSAKGTVEPLLPLAYVPLSVEA